MQSHQYAYQRLRESNLAVQRFFGVARAADLGRDCCWELKDPIHACLQEIVRHMIAMIGAVSKVSSDVLN